MKVLKTWAGPFFLSLSIAFICYGAWRGESNMALQKAVKLCMECIGIG